MSGENHSETKVDRFEVAWAKIVEWYPQAVLIVDDKESGFLRWRSVDSTWALGAAERMRRDILENTEKT